MHTLTGTRRLVRLALRRDRVKLPVWILAIAGMVAANIPAVTSLYGKNMQSQIEYAATTAPSLVSRIFGGPINGPNIGEIVVNEVFLFTAIAAAFMSTLAVVRHTRQNEETGRSELIGSTVVGRHANLVAALIVAVAANIALTILVALATIGGGLETKGSIGLAAALGATGIAFAAVAAVTAQLSDSARGANSMAAAAIGVAFLLRGIGDSLGTLTPDKLGIQSAWPSWLSPLGWGQQLHPYTENNWWLFGVFAVFSVGVSALALYWNAIRDTGIGMIASRKGPARAPRSLLGVNGLARRLQRGTLRGWSVSIVILGLTLGLVSKEFANMFKDNPDLQAYLGGFGDGSTFESLFFSSMLVFMAIAISAYAVQSLQRMRAEEASGQLESVLATGVSKPGWMLSHITYTIAGIVTLLLLLGVSMSTIHVLIADASWSKVTELTSAALVHTPAILVVAGVATAVFGILPRAAVGVSWSAFVLCLLIGQFGEILKLPQAAKNISPFTHTPLAPAADVSVLPLALLLGAALSLMTIGLIGFRRRDLATA